LIRFHVFAAKSGKESKESISANSAVHSGDFYTCTFDTPETIVDCRGQYIFSYKWTYSWRHAHHSKKQNNGHPFCVLHNFQTLCSLLLPSCSSVCLIFFSFRLIPLLL